MGITRLGVPHCTTAYRLTITPNAYDLIYDTDLNQLFVGDGTTVGGRIAGGGGGGETNTASNLGDGAGLFKEKVDVDLKFKGLKSPDNSVQIDNSPDGNSIYLSVNPTVITAGLIGVYAMGELLDFASLTVFNFASGIIIG